jgi:cytochrome c biogenesis factor
MEAIWACEPVEDVSLRPCLPGAVLLHAVMMQGKKGMLKI